MLIVCLALTFASCSNDKEGSGDQTTTKKAVTTRRDPGNIDDDIIDNDGPLDTNVYIVHGTASIDGVKEDAWNDAQGVVLENSVKDTPDAATVVTAYAMWDESGLYFFFDIVDSAISQSGALGDYNNDGIYLYISETLDFTQSDMNTYSNGTYQFAIINEDLTMIPRKGEAGDFTTEDYQVSINPKADNTGLTIEFHYNPKHLELTAGSQLSIEYQYNDCKDGTRLGCLKWYGTADGNANPIDFGVGTLLADGEKVPAAE